MCVGISVSRHLKEELSLATDKLLQTLKQLAMLLYGTEE